MGDSQGGCSFSGGVPGPGGSLGPPAPPPHPSHPRLGRAPSGAGVEALLGLGARLGLAFQRIRFLRAGAAPLRPTPAGVWAWQMGVAGMGPYGHSPPPPPRFGLNPRLGSRPVVLSSWSPSSQRWFPSQCAGGPPGCRGSHSFPICANGLSEKGQVGGTGPPTHDPPKLEF